MKPIITLLLITLASLANAQLTFVDLDNRESVAFNKILDNNQVIAIGELHGTTEVPLFVLELAKASRERHDSITVALEISKNFQKDIDAFLIHGETEMLKSLKQFQHKDGRSSIAMVHLLSGLRALKGIKVACFDVAWNTANSDTRDSLMGINLSTAYDGKPMIILTGNLHASIDLGWMRPGFKSALYHFKERSKPGTDIVALNTYFGGGTAWNCTPDGCAVYGIGRYPAGETQGLTSFIRYDKKTIEDGFNGIVYFEKVSASLPFTHDDQKLNEVVEKFQSAIIEKDSIAFQKLFFHDKVPFVGIMSGLTELSIKKDYPGFQGIAVSNSRKFINEICRADKAQREQFYNTSIKTDGIIASVSFDYGYYSGEKMVQWGHENWNLVFVENEWLITDVVYSIHFPDIEPFPFID